MSGLMQTVSNWWNGGSTDVLANLYISDLDDDPVLINQDEISPGNNLVVLPDRQEQEWLRIFITR